MNLIADIKRPIAEELKLFEDTFTEALQSGNPLLSKVNEYIRQGSGKQLRPVLVLLSAKICGSINRSTIESAAALELLHTASLIHDDVVDDTYERRGKKSVNAQWNNKIAILSGDYMLSNALHYAAMTGNMSILNLIADIGMQLSDGELLQLAGTEHINLTEEEYFNIIRKKTALLFSTCMEIGALSAGGPEGNLLRLRKFGEYLGICFQLKDDIFDYNENAGIGKPTGNDIREGKLTLPLIYSLHNVYGKERDDVLELIRQKDFSPQNIHRILDFARVNGGIEYARKQMDLYKVKAAEQLDSFPESEIKDALLTSVRFVVEREY